MWPFVSSLIRPLEYFKDDGKIADDIAKIRQLHFEERRKRKIRTIEDVIKYGVLNALKDTFPGAATTRGSDNRLNFSAVGKQNMMNVSHFDLRVCDTNLDTTAKTIPNDSELDCPTRYHLTMCTRLWFSNQPKGSFFSIDCS